jgi:hypothetical protein
MYSYGHSVRRTCVAALVSSQSHAVVKITPRFVRWCHGWRLKIVQFTDVPARYLRIYCVNDPSRSGSNF